MARGSRRDPAAPGRRPLSATAIAAAACELIEEEGLDALSMRRLADRLDTRAASLYRHVQNKEHVLDLVADSLLTEPDLQVAAHPGEGWRSTLTRVALTYRSFLLRRRDADRVLAGRFVVGPSLARLVEPVLETLLQAGLGPRDSAYAFYLVIVHVQGFVLHEKSPLSGSNAAGESRETTLASIQQLLQAMPEEEFPRVHEVAPYLAEPGLDARFRMGLDWVLDGLASRLRAREDVAASSRGPA